MDQIQRVVLCGDSVFMLAIDASLAALPGVETSRFNPHLPDLSARIAAQEPNLILLEKKMNDEIPLELLHEDIPSILINPEERNITTINSAVVQKAEIGDLVQIIQRSLQDAAAQKKSN